jgi:3-oxoacyl-[acyl-carrier protein] reductase
VIARRLGSEGATVIAAARTTEALDRIVAAVGGAGRAIALALDLADPDSIEAGVKAALAAHGRIDVLVNNAGVTEDNLVLRMSKASWDRVLATNLTGAFLLTQAVVKSMVRQRYGRIVNVTSVVGLMGNAGQANYAASKAGLVGLTKSVARELASRNITCNAVAPGFIATAMTEKMTDDAKAKLSGQIPLARLGSPDDVAAAVAYLASEEASYVTGHVLNVSGGLYM